MFSQNQRFRLDGEYGLWVQEVDGQVEVHWITAKEDSGFLHVYHDHTLLQQFTTPVSQSHLAKFVKPDMPNFSLHYGGLSDEIDRHETKICLDTKKADVRFVDVDSVFVLGDLHGQFENLIQLLQNADIIDSNLNWSGHHKHLVALGDIFDRGHNVTRTLWFLYELEKQAEKRGGKVHLLLGNHEIMTFLNDLRYLSGKENLIANLHNTQYASMFDPQRSVIGKWLAIKPGVIKIDEILFSHGGVDPIFNGYSIEALNDSLWTYLNEDGFSTLLQDSLAFTKYDSVLYHRRLYFFFGEKSVFWHRGYVSADTLGKDLNSVLKNFKSKLHVIAHTPVKTITSFYDGKVIGVDLASPGTEMLLLVRTGKKKYEKYKYKITGELEPL
ncbi:hypothetical protein GWO43_18085 [candidate division KSB1 bacterium]|nr:hypothetical protein [candidate division KSB1 bacterium]NIR69969.1 hypothetical protein [candidate division KSB1 bacterium]NIS25868.1 hypothetical protein [candidate division KSB1 bacterium]NIT72745.1 hypothetical protein [candidate division KSB1 bacterium]NIU26557.1 hypothetical protein [candidate division KSB1 bacterium]